MISGVLLVDKSEGPTSHDVVEWVRGALGTRRVGHTGTLDPFASGLLILCVGRATRLSEYFHIPEKRYEAELTLGAETTSHDREGEVVSASDDWRQLSLDRVRRALHDFQGPILQRPPAWSAKRVDGHRAHGLARAGSEVELAPAPVTVHSLRLLSFEPPRLRIAARVSTGTYIRALARDLGRELGCGAHLTSLRRVAIGDLSVNDGIPDRSLIGGPAVRERILSSEAWLEPGESLSWLPSRQLSEEELALVGVGRAIPAGGAGAGGTDAGWTGPAWAERPVRLVHDGRLVAVAERADGALRPRKVFVG